MYLKRDRLIALQIETNKQSKSYTPLNKNLLKRLEDEAHEQLSTQKVVNR